MEKTIKVLIMILVHLQVQEASKKSKFFFELKLGHINVELELI
jgi:hypothetical protein